MVVGVGPFEITPRSVIGVKEFAPPSNPGRGVPSANVAIELFAGVVSGLWVVRSSLWKHTTPTAFPAKAAWIPAQVGMANVGLGRPMTVPSRRESAAPY